MCPDSYFFFQRNTYVQKQEAHGTDVKATKNEKTTQRITFSLLLMQIKFLLILRRRGSFSQPFY